MFTFIVVNFLVLTVWISALTLEQRLRAEVLAAERRFAPSEEGGMDMSKRDTYLLPECNEKSVGDVMLIGCRSWYVNHWTNSQTHGQTNRRSDLLREFIQDNLMNCVAFFESYIVTHWLKFCMYFCTFGITYTKFPILGPIVNWRSKIFEVWNKKAIFHCI